MSTNHAPRIAVVGSLNMDLVLQVHHDPQAARPPKAGHHHEAQGRQQPLRAAG